MNVQAIIENLLASAIWSVLTWGLLKCADSFKKNPNCDSSAQDNNKGWVG
jgi:hypothetical protein